MTATVTAAWAGTITATSSIVHGGITRGTITLLRREQIYTSTGWIDIPLISGNAMRGRLRRVAEQLFTDALDLPGQISLAAAHTLRSGGTLTKSGKEPLSGDRLRQLRELVPVVDVFGAATAGRIIDGRLSVSKLIPCLAETTHLTGQAGPDLASATQLEQYVHQPDTDAPDDVAGADANRTMVWHVETFPAGTRFSSSIQLRRASPIAAAFTAEVIAALAREPLGGRGAIGHGSFTTDYTVTGLPLELPDWRAELVARRAEVLTALALLT